MGVPDFKIGDAGFAYDDAVGGGDGEGQRKFADGPDGDFLDGAVGYYILAVGTEEEGWVELLHDEVEGFVDGVLLSAHQEDSGEFVLDIETGNLAYLDGDEFVEERDEEVRAVVFERGGKCRYGYWRRWCGKAFEFVEGATQVFLSDGFEEIVDAVDLEGLEGVLVVGGGEDDGTGDVHLVEDVEGETVGKVDVHEAEVGIRGCGRGVELLEVFDALLNALYDGEDVESGRQLGERALEVLRGHNLVFDNEDVFHGGVRLRGCRR